MTTTEHDTGQQHHPSVWVYIKVAIFLAIVTGLEVGVVYIEQLPQVVLVLSLVAMMAIKFAVVVLWFMHLKFDSKLFSQFFWGGLALAVSLFVIVLVTFGVFTS